MVWRWYHFRNTPWLYVFALVLVDWFGISVSSDGSFRGKISLPFYPHHTLVLKFSFLEYVRILENIIHLYIFCNFGDHILPNKKMETEESHWGLRQQMASAWCFWRLWTFVALILWCWSGVNTETWWVLWDGPEWTCFCSFPGEKLWAVDIQCECARYFGYWDDCLP